MHHWAISTGEHTLVKLDFCSLCMSMLTILRFHTDEALEANLLPAPYDAIFVSWAVQRKLFVSSVVYTFFVLVSEYIYGIRKTEGARPPTDLLLSISLGCFRKITIYPEKVNRALKSALCMYSHTLWRIFKRWWRTTQGNKYDSRTLQAKHFPRHTRQTVVHIMRMDHCSISTNEHTLLKLNCCSLCTNHADRFATPQTVKHCKQLYSYTHSAKVTHAQIYHYVCFVGVRICILFVKQWKLGSISSHGRADFHVYTVCTCTNTVHLEHKTV